ncbi:alpha-hydroxy-acid oxidizing protein [Jatrophihabitans fulvus]
MTVAQLVRRCEDAARAGLPAEVVDYVAGGSGTETTLGDEPAAWARHRLRPRVLRDAPAPSTAVDLLGHALPSPVAVAPVGYQQLVHPDGECATAAGAAGHLLVTSARSDRTPEDIGACRTGPWWHQHYVTVDEAVGNELAVRAAAAGATAVVLTVDTPRVASKARQGRLRPLPPGAEQRPVRRDDIARLMRLTGLPVIVKGVLRADDACRALDLGAAGLVVSTHGGRQLDRAVASAVALPDVVDVAGAAPVLVDGGVRSGHDVLVALALGARAVLVGRPLVWALATGGAQAVADLLTAYTAEVAEVLELAGCADPSDVGRDLIAPSPDGRQPDESDPSGMG